jgi:hypothetical protein
VPIQTLRPNLTSRAGTWTLTGAATAHEALSDDDDGSYLAHPDSSAGSVTAAFGVTDPTFPTSAKIKAVRSRLRGSKASGDGVVVWLSAGTSVGDEFPLTTSVATHEGAWRSSRPSGGEWSWADVAGAQQVLSVFDGVGRRVHELYLDVDYNERPEVLVNGPAATVTDTSRPTIAWSYSDAEGDPQEAYEVRLFLAADAAGSTPPGSGAVWASGEVLSTATSRQVPVDLLESSDYRVFVRARQSWDGPSKHWSTWDYLDFTTALSPPDAPLLTVEVDEAEGRMLLHVAPVEEGLEAEWLTVETSLDGESWRPVRFTGDLLPLEETVADYEAPPNLPVLYRARAYRVVDDETIASPPTVVASSFPLRHRWLKDILNPDNNMRVKVFDTGGSVEGRDQVFRLAGRKMAVVVSDVAGGIDDSLQWHVLDDAEWEQAKVLLASTRPLLFQSHRDHRYVRLVGSRGWSQPYPDSTGHRAISVSLVETDEPLEGR